LGWPFSEPHTHHNYNYDYNSCANDHDYINNDEHNNYNFNDDNRFTNNDNYDSCPNHYLAAISS
jgi:hypothetical protein